MNELGEEGTEGTWRQFTEHPLTAATTAMLNIHGNEEQQQQVTLLYDYCRSDGLEGHSPRMKTRYDLHPFMNTQRSAVGSPVMGGALDCKITNGVSEGVAGAVPVDGLLFVGSADGVKREPEDLTRRAVSPADRGVLCDKRRLPLAPPDALGDSPPALDTAPALKDGLDHHVIKEELDHHVDLKVEPGDRPRSNHTLVIHAPLDSGDKMSAGTGSYIGGFSAASPQSSYEHVSYLSPSPQPYTTSSSSGVRGSPAAVYTVTDNYYRDYYTATEPQYTVRPEYTTADVVFGDRYLRPPYKTNGVSSTLTVDLPSPADSGISADAVTPRDQPVITQSFGYEEMVQPGSLLGTDLRAGGSPNSQRPTRPWHDFARHTEADKIQIPKIHTDDDKINIPKLFSQYGFKYHLETPISTSQRREDDRITYINKGQFYGITMEYIPDPEKPLKSGIVKSVVMLVFREEKTQEDEIKAWQFWHSRQHSVKQRILDVGRASPRRSRDATPHLDSKNSVGLVGCIEEVAHNAIVVFWNPLEAGGKINIAIQCLSTDFSSQKGVKGLPLHVQIDTYEDPREAATLLHRGYCQIKVFCDKGAERKTRDEERRAAKRRMAATTRKKYEDLYHQPCDRSEFYSMSDLAKPPVLFTPAEDDKISMELQGFYSHDSDNGGSSAGVPGTVGVDCSPPSDLSPQHGFPSTPGRCMSPPPHSHEPPPPPQPSAFPPPPPPTSSTILSTSMTQLVPLQVTPPPAVSPKANSYKFHYSFSSQPYGIPLDTGLSTDEPQNLTGYRMPLDTGLPTGEPCSPIRDGRKELTGGPTLPNGTLDSPMSDVFSHVSKRSRLTPPLNERLMLFVRQDGEDVYTALHLVPPSTLGLLSAIEEKYKIPTQSIKNLYRKNKVGIMAKIDDEMLRHYCNEDLFLMEVQPRDADSYDLIFIELTGTEH